MTDDPLNEQLMMRAIHHYRFWWLFDQDGKPAVLYRRRQRATKTQATTQLIVEWGGLDHPTFSDDARKEFAQAWDDHQTWKKAMA